MERIRVQLFGTPAVGLAGGVVRPVPLSVQPLLAYLALEPRPARHRDRVTEALWPDVDPDRSRRRLNTAVWRIRTLLDCAGSGVLGCGTSGHLEMSPEVAVDAREMADFVELRNGRVHAVEDDWEHLVHLDDEEFVSGCYHDWVVETRLSLSHAINQCLEHTILALRESGQTERALACARALARREPYREEVHRTVIRLATELGRYAEAERQYEHCVAVLRSELAVQPVAETVLAAAEARRLRLGEHPTGEPQVSALRSLDDALRHCRSAIEAVECATRLLDSI